MKIKNYVFIFGGLLLLIILGFNLSLNILEKDPITLGYCPTMEKIAKEIQSNNNYVSLVPFDYTAAALTGLKNKDVDSVLVGRLADESELTNVYETRLRGGLTLVGKQKILIPEHDLENIRIHTYVDEQKVLEYLPMGANVVYYEYLDLAVSNGLDEVVLIDWDDYSDDLELIIPMNQNMEKIEKFRIPVLYSFNGDLVEKLRI